MVYGQYAKGGKSIALCINTERKNNPRKSGVSPGRLLTSIALGLPVIAEPLDSYLPFKEFFAFTNSDRARGIS